jgi:hypothetical protein
MALPTADALYGEVLALRVVVQHLLTKSALASSDPKDSVRSAHERATDELAGIVVDGGPPERIEALRIHAGTVLDSIYAVAATAIDRPNTA